MLATRPARTLPGRRLSALALACTVAAMLGLGALETGGDAVLLVPLTGAAARALPHLALDGRTQLVGAGLVPGSLVVRRPDGSRPALLAYGILAIAVPLKGCTAGAAA